ncbi:MAG: response regulator [Desulfobacteraceae bacterium]|nr:MAG: response regulator [Desulfobacteraceae bacterium]
MNASRLDFRIALKGGNPMMFVENLQIGNSDNKIEQLEHEIQILRTRMLEQRELEEQLFHAQKMESLANLAAGIAHDLNNILQSVLGYTQIALLEKAGTDPDYEIFQKIERIIVKGCDLTRQFLTFGRRIHSELQPLNLHTKIIEIKELLHRTIPRMIDIEVYSTADLNLIKADSGQIDQILMNLSINAKDAMPDHGRLIFKTENVLISAHHPLTRFNAQPGPYVLLTVTDTGTGMTPEVKKQIFEPFFTTKAKSNGTGLGLAMVYAIVKNHNGFIDVLSEPGQGASFKIHFPALHAQAATPGLLQNDGPKINFSLGHERILFVDDESDILKIGREILEKHGYEVHTAQNGEEALKQYNRFKIDLVILDVGMPGMGGIKCLQQIMALDPKAKILICSGYAPSDLVRKALELGAADYLTKPFPIENLPRSARSVLDKQS